MYSSVDVLTALGTALHNEGGALPVTVQVGDTTVTLRETPSPYVQPEIGGVVGKGGFKKFFNLDGTNVFGIPNLDTVHSEMSGVLASTWEHAVQVEAATADKVKKAGLETQNFEVQPLKLDGAEMPVLVAPSFAALAEAGTYIRDPKYLSFSSDHAMLFGTPQNLEDPQRLRMVMKDTLDDCVKIVAQGFSFGTDVYHLAIKDTENSPPYDKDSPGLFDERGQQVRLFLSDFAEKAEPTQTERDGRLRLLDETNEPDEERVRRRADKIVTRAFETIQGSMREEEIIRILELKDGYPSEHEYNSSFEIRELMEAQFDSIKDQLVADVAARSMEVIREMPLAVRLERFRGSTDSPPLTLPGGGRPEEISLGQQQGKSQGL